MEMFDLYDENENLLNETHVRGDAIPWGKYHLVVEVMTFSNHKLLVTKRHPNKPYGNEWEVTGGSVLAGESILDGALRELKEETGIVCEPDELKMYSSDRGEFAFYKRFVLFKDVKIEDVVLQEGETVDAKFVSLDEWLDMIDQGVVAKPIVDRYLKYKDIIDRFFEEV